MGLGDVYKRQEAGVQSPGLRDSIGGGRRYQGTGTEGSSTTDITTTNKDRDGGFTPGDGTRLRDTGTNAGDRAASIQEESARTGRSIAEIGRERAPSTAETQTDVEEATGGQGNQGLGSGAGGMNKGGLMANKKKKKK